MGFIEFIIFCFIVLGLAWIGTYALGAFLPGHPGIVDKLIWGIAVILVIIKFAQAIGLGGADVQIPSIK